MNWNQNIFVSNNSWFLKLKKQPTPRDEEKESFKSKESPMEVDKTISSETKSQVTKYLTHWTIDHLYQMANAKF